MGLSKPSEYAPPADLRRAMRTACTELVQELVEATHLIEEVGVRFVLRAIDLPPPGRVHS